MRRRLLQLLSVVVVVADQWWESASEAALTKALFIRGVACDACPLTELKEVVKAHAGTPVDHELVTMYEEEQRYKMQARKLNMTKPEFFKQINSSEDGALDHLRAERAWRSFQAQLESGGVLFYANGTMSFAMPFTHRLAPMLPAALCDAIEDAFFWLRDHYLRLVPRKVRRRLERRLDYAANIGVLYAAVAFLGVFLILAVRDDLRSSRESAADQKKKT